MKVVLFSNNICSVPAMQFLADRDMLQAVVCTGAKNPLTLQFEQTARLLNVPFRRFNRQELLTGLKNWLLELKPGLCLSFGYGYKIPPALFNIPGFGFYNVHFSLLPAYRGRLPVFWQLKNGEQKSGITIHRLSDEYDEGKILLQKEIPVSPGDNHGLLTGRLSMESIMLVAQAIAEVQSAPDALLTRQDEAGASFAPMLTMDDLKINWETQSAAEIENLVNAANPDYGGALVMVRGQAGRLLEVNQAQLNGPGDAPPGTIVYADVNHGIFAACKDGKYLRINIIQTSEGILSGFKLAGLGIAAGERLETMK